jgi:RNA polymerase sigma factor (sigma-70 family)
MADPVPTAPPIAEPAGPPGTSDAFAEWVRPHLVAMHRLAARLAPSGEADDVIQDALDRAWRRRSTYVSDRGAPRTWLLAIVADQARKARVRAGRRRVPWRRPPEISPQPTCDLDLERALGCLTHRQRAVIDLHYYVDLTTRETGEVLGIAEGTVKSTLADARARLRTLMRADEEGSDG